MTITAYDLANMLSNDALRQIEKHADNAASILRRDADRSPHDNEALEAATEAQAFAILAQAIRAVRHLQHNA